MRQRKVKNLDIKYEEYEDILIREPAAMKGRWAQRSKGRPVYVEIGCGKGKFISELAAREPDHFFVAIEGNMSVMLRAMEKVRQAGLDNVVFTPEFADDLSEWFAYSEAQGIYLNFSDPLPKNYWYRRRLTYRKRLLSYFRVLPKDGTVTFKTDNTDFFEWSLLEIMAADLKVLDITRDLHAEVMSIEDPEKRALFNIETEYEAKFSGLGEKIKRVVIGRKQKEEADKVNKTLAAYNGRTIPENITDISDGRVQPDKKSAAEAIEYLYGSYEPKVLPECCILRAEQNLSDLWSPIFHAHVTGSLHQTSTITYMMSLPKTWSGRSNASRGLMKTGSSHQMTSDTESASCSATRSTCSSYST